MNALHDQFIIEARDLVAQATEDLLLLERDKASAERVDRVFRAFHTLKGSAGVVELPEMAFTLHAAEDLLAAIHAGRLAVDRALVDQALACLDLVSEWVDAFEARSALPASSDAAARTMARRLRAFLSTTPTDTSTRNTPPIGAHDMPEWARRCLDLNSNNVARARASGRADLIAVCYEPAAGCFFDGDDPLDLMRKVPDLVALQIEPREPWPALDSIDPFTCNLRLVAISAASHAEVAAVFRLVSDQIAIVDIPIKELTRARTDQASDTLVLLIVKEQHEVLRAAGDRPDLPSRIAAAARTAANALRYFGEAARAERILAASDAAVAQLSAAPVIDALVEIIGEMSPSESAVGGDPSDAGAGVAEGGERTVVRSLRVDEARIDVLVNLVGELATMRNAIGHLAQRVEETAVAPELSRAIRRECDTLGRLTAEMHAAILQLRMVPVAQVFRAFPRLVRDMAGRLGKNVALVTRGETTESDKTIVDQLLEPLLHLVRNALDHGIETPDARRDAGKPETSTLIIAASRSGDRFLLEVTDDGRGIDPGTVRRKAVDSALMPPDELAALTDEQVLDLIFSAGFSTAAEISDISGRGVGMDVVRDAIERIGGRVSVRSHVGQGTTVVLDLPLTIAMSQIMIVEAGGEVFGIPMEAVSKTVRLAAGDISRIKNNDGFVLDDRIVPLCSLAELMNFPRANSPAPERLAVVAEVGGRIAALEVDAIRDRQEVVLRPMQGVLANVHGYAGTTLLGDGTVLLVLDLKGVMP